jgi:toxin ParE1/3/4
MAYLVRTMPRAERDLAAIFGYIGGLNSPPAKRWLDGLVASIASLSEHPQRHPAIPENPSLRHLLYGNKPHIYRVIYSIDMTRQQVDIVHIRHHARDAFKPEKVRQ